MITKLMILLIVAAAIGAAMYIPSARMTSTPAYAAPEEVMAQQVTINGRQAGEVLVDGQVVFRIRTSAGGFTPYQRAEIVAQRLRGLTDDSIRSEDVDMGRVNGQDVVMAGGHVIVTADRAHARLNGTTTSGLAALWSQSLSNAVAGRPVQATRVGEKIVPIISVGSGTRVGGALVAGSSSRLDEVVAVAQIEGQFGNAVRVRALVPVSTENVVQNIRRVPETAVIGLVDIKL